MWHYVLYFLSGGAVITAAVYVGSRGNGVLAAFVASLPILTLLNVFLMYRNDGIAVSTTYAKGVLLFLPVFACYIALTIWLLPHLGMPKALMPGLLIYAIPILIRALGVV